MTGVPRIGARVKPAPPTSRHPTVESMSTTRTPSVDARTDRGTGADLARQIAVISAVFGSGDPATIRAQAARFAALFDA